MSYFGKIFVLALTLILCTACSQNLQKTENPKIESSERKTQSGLLTDNEQNVSQTDNLENLSENENAINSAINNATISWDSPQKMEKQGFFPEYDQTNEAHRELTYFEDETDYYKVGKINGGKYADAEIILVISTPYFPSHFRHLFRFVKKENQYILIDQYSDSLGQTDLIVSNVVLETSTELNTLFTKELEIPEEIEVNHSKLILEQKTPIFFETKNLVAVDLTETEFSDLNGRLFFEKNAENAWEKTDQRIFQSNGFFLKMPDETTVIYALEIPFFEAEEKYLPQIIWNDETQNTKMYLAAEGHSCGFKKGTFAYVVHNTVPMSSYAEEDAIASGFPKSIESLIEVPFADADLEIVGSSSENAEPIYGFKDSNHPVLKDFYKKNYAIYFQDIDDGEILSYEDYLQTKPFLFWKDSFGRKIMLISLNIYMPPVCGAKPVIYLYPEEKQKINVEVETDRKLFTTYPEYNEGWQVLADQEGNLFDLNSKIFVPYLFWEDLLNYLVPQKGFVVKKENVANFLNEKLSFVGLNKKEIRDFQEYWLPKMQDDPFYFITFLQTAEMNAIAPLKISPQPDNLLRIFMHFEGLEEKIEIEELSLEKIERNGFTAVEWGGKLK